MKKLTKRMCGEIVQIELTEDEYSRALEQAIKDLDIETQDEAEKRDAEINEYLVDYFKEDFEERLQEIGNETQSSSNYYNELKSWCNKHTGV